jgi:hypothetical protein
MLKPYLSVSDDAFEVGISKVYMGYNQLLYIKQSIESF